MGMTDTGLADHVKKWIGEATTNFNNANTYMGVGNGTAVFDSTQTDLQGASKLRKGMETSYPARDPDSDGSDNKVRFQSIYGTAEANFQWQEWGIFNASTAGVMHNREVEYIGEKTDKASWTFSVDITLV